MTTRPPRSPSIAIVGAGLAGLTAAEHLLAHGARVALFDKGRTVGGRLASKGREQGGHDHGAPRFAAHDAVFVETVRAWQSSGLVVPTEGVATWLPVPSTNSLAQELAQRLRRLAPSALELRVSSRVTSLRRAHGRWWLAVEGAEEAGPYDAVISTAPAPQTLALVGGSSTFEALARVAYAPCWTLLASLEPTDATALPSLLFNEVTAAEHPLALVIRAGLAPERVPDGALVRVVAHATPAFSTAHLEDDEPSMRARLLEALATVPGFAHAPARVAKAHRWRFARVVAPLDEPFLFDRDRGLAVAGDAFRNREGREVEAAWSSGLAVARAVLTHLAT